MAKDQPFVQVLEPISKKIGNFGGKVKTSLVNYYLSTLGSLKQFSNGHLAMQHLSCPHLSI